jgi:hypothetical protein
MGTIHEDALHAGYLRLQTHTRNFLALKDVVRGRHIRSDDEVKKAVQVWPSQQPKDVFSRGIYTILERWSRCVEGGGDYIED